MAVDNTQVIDESFLASSSLATKQYYFVKLSANNTIVICNGATDVPIGVLQDKPGAGQWGRVRIVGKTKISSDAGLTAGNLIGTSGDGQADAKTPGGDTTEYVCGQVTLGTGTAGDIGEAIINCASPHRAA